MSELLTPADQHDHDTRMLAPFIMRTAHCTRDRAIEFICKCSAEERKLLLRLRLFSRPKSKPRRRKVDIKHCATPFEAHPIVRDHLHSMAWSKPR